MEDNQLEKIEICGRTCYQSADKITEESNIQFVKNIVKRKHYSVLEHASAAIACSNRIFKEFDTVDINNKRFFSVEKKQNSYLISGNFRAWLEFLQKYADDFKEIQHVLCYFFPAVFSHFCPSPESSEEAVLIKFAHMNQDELSKHYRPSVRFIADRGFLGEIRTHRDASFSAESSRYVLYSDSVDGNEMTVIEPFYYVSSPEKYTIWERAMENAEVMYTMLIGLQSSPQEARSVLPMSLKTDVVVTANIVEWKHIFELRAAPAAHPQMRQLLIPLEEEFFTLAISI